MDIKTANTRLIYQSLRSVSFGFFAIIGFAHFLTGLLLANQIAPKGMWLTSRLLDVPFFLVSYLYLAAIFKLKLDPASNKFNLWDLIIIAVGLLSFLFLQIYDLVFPNLLP